MGPNKFKICIECITYNHAPYIVDCMNSFTVQQTKFPYVCCILDDASSDDEPEVVRKYMQENFNLEDESVVRIVETNDYVFWFAQHKTNKNCYFAVYFLKYNHYSIKKDNMQYIDEWHNNAKYIAYCEGDDYWTESMKLQKQYDFMEAHPECSLCFHAYENLLPSGEKQMRGPQLIKQVYDIKDIILAGSGFMSTNSMFFLGKLVKNNDRPDFWKNCPVGDAPVKLLLAAKGLVGYIDDTMSVHRVLVPGSWTSKQQNIKNKRKHHVAILKMYDEYDAYTGYKYHDVIKRKKRENCRVMLRREFSFLIRRMWNTIKQIKNI